MSAWYSRSVLFVGLVGCSTGVVEPVDPACPTLLACPEPVQATCSGPQTPVAVPDATSCAIATTQDDRAASYPLGDTVLTFQASTGLLDLGIDATCGSTVTVVDPEPPIVACDPTARFARATPDEPYPEPPVGVATDVCDPDNITVTVSPAALDGAETVVTTTAVDGSGNEATCDTLVEVLDLFAPSDVRLLAAELDGAETVLTLGWDGAPSDEVTEIQVQRAPAADGPWETVQAVDADRVTVEVDQQQTGWWRLRSASDELVGGATEPLQVHAIGTDSYNIGGASVPRVPFATSLYGVVRHPVDLDGGPYPLVVLLHGNHGNCRRNGTRDDFCATLTTHECDFAGFSTAPNAEGMVFQAETLAAHGFIAVTISANALNCRGGYILERAQLIGEHLRRWKGWNEGGDGLTRFAGAVDLSRVGLVGHSRGGDAVSHMPQLLVDTPIQGVDVVSIFATAPTDYNDATVFDASWALLLPVCDGDVSNLWGTDIYERSRSRVWHKSQVMMAGANHNYFSTEWAFDDGSRVCASRDRVGLAAQVSMLDATLGSWMARTLDDDLPEAFQRAETPMPVSVVAHIPRQVDLRWSYTHDGALMVEAFDDDPTSNALGGDNLDDGFALVTPCEGSSCGGAFLHPTTALATSWEAGAEPSLTCTFNGTDTGPFDAVQFRMVSRVVGVNNGRVEQPYSVLFSDADGQQARLSSEELTRVPHAYGGYNVREVMQTIRVPFARLQSVNADLDLSRLASVSLELGTDGAAGAVTVTDVELGY